VQSDLLLLQSSKGEAVVVSIIPIISFESIFPNDTSKSGALLFNPLATDDAVST